jgi:uncharacterized protein YlxP (DUF503 family)
MHLGLLTIELHIPTSLSLKDKRGITKSIKDRIRKKFNVAVAEIGFQDKWQRSEIAFATLSADRALVDETLQKIFSLLDRDLNFEIVKHSFEYR